MHQKLNIDFRSANPEDIPKITEMIGKLYATENTEFVETDVSNALKELVNNDRFGAVFLIYYNDKLAGYISITAFFSIEFKGETAFIDELYIEEDFRGKGIGAKAVDFALNYAAGKGYKALRLEVEHLNQTAQKLYTKKGFIAHNRNIMTKWLNR